MPNSHFDGLLPLAGGGGDCVIIKLYCHPPQGGRGLKKMASSGSSPAPHGAGIRPPARPQGLKLPPALPNGRAGGSAF